MQARPASGLDIKCFWGGRSALSSNVPVPKCVDRQARKPQPCKDTCPEIPAGDTLEALHCCLQAESRRILLLEHTLRTGLAVPGLPSGFTLLLSWGSVPFTHTALGRLWLCPF